MTLPGRLARRLRRKPQLHWLDIVSRDLSQDIKPYPARLPFRFEILPQDSQAVAKRLNYIPEIHRSDLERRINNNHVCCIAEYQGQIVFVSWIAREVCNSYLLDRKFELADDEAYFYSAYTILECRGIAIHPSGTAQRLNYLKQQGYSRAYVFMEPRNAASQLMPAKVGYK